MSFPVFIGVYCGHKLGPCKTTLLRIFSAFGEIEKFFFNTNFYVVYYKTARAADRAFYGLPEYHVGYHFVAL